MNSALKKHTLWIYPMLFGFLGAALGLVLRYAFTGALGVFPLKHVLHSHSHVMLLGFIFNALLLAVWQQFTEGMDRLSKRLFIGLQMGVVGMLVSFIIEGYALFSISFSTCHLWLSYVLLIRLWKRLKGAPPMVGLLKLGIVFHFLASLGPYALGPLMAMNMQASPWYQQAIFFYLHFQYFGVLFVWLLALLLRRSTVMLKTRYNYLIGIALLGGYTHSLDYSFEHWGISILGGLSASLFLWIWWSFRKGFHFAAKPYRFLYYIILLIGLLNIVGSWPSLANWVATDRMALIAWLHALFLGLYTPFIWIVSKYRIPYYLWIFYAVSFLISEFILLFPTFCYENTGVSIMQLLFLGYLGVFICICIVHLGFLFKFKS